MIKVNLPTFRESFPDSLISPQEKKLARIRGYEFNWSEYANKLFELDRPDDNPSWLKAITDVRKSEGFWRGFYEALLGKAKGKLQGTNASDYALDHVLTDRVTGVMQFLPANSTNEEACKVADLAKALLPDWFVIPLNGDSNVTNESAEELVSDYVRKAEIEGKRGVWVISQGMAARSFSIPAINVVLLTYDNGSLGATVQKMSRCLTAGTVDKIGHILSFSIDGNRNDVIAELALATALKVAEEEEESVEAALQRVRRTIPIFDLDENGDPMEITPDEYLERAMTLTSAKRLVVDKQILLTMTMEDCGLIREILADLPSQVQRLGGKSVPFLPGVRFVEGRLVDRSQRELTEEDLAKQLLEELNRKIVTLTERLDLLVFFLPDASSEVSVEALFSSVYSDQDIFRDFQETFSVTPGELNVLLDKKLINREMLEVVMLKKRDGLPHFA